MIREKTALGYVALAGLAAVLFFWRLGDLPFYSEGEPREGLQVWEIFHRGAWLLQLRNGTEIPAKPPLFHWFGGLIALLAGDVDELTLRLPSALVATAVVLGTAWLAARKWGAPAGAYAGCILATNFEWIRAARTARVDMLLTGCLTVAFAAFEHVASATRASPWALVAFYGAMAFATLAKGPVGFALPVLVAVAYLAIRHDLGRVRHLHPVLGLVCAAGIPAAWYALAIARLGWPFIHKQVLAENVLRFFGSATGGHNVSHPFYYYGSTFLTGFAPWSFFLIPLAAHLFHLRRRPEFRPYLYPLLWFGVVLAFFSAAAGKRSVYILSAYPAAAVLLGGWWSQLSSGSAALGRLTQWGLRFVTGISAAAAMLVGAVLLAEGAGGSPFDALRPYLHHRDQANLPLVVGTLRGHFGVLLAWVGALAVAAFLLLASTWRRRWAVAFGALVALAASVAIAVNGVFHPVLARDRTFKPFVAAVNALVAQAPLFFYRSFDYGTVFYARRHIPVLRSELDTVTPEEPLYLLIRERDWEQAPRDVRTRWDVVLRSHGTGPQGRNRLILARLRGGR